MKGFNFPKQLIAWQKVFGRNDLPWQKFNTPYERLLSEVMLQQTQVETVKPYFIKFLEAFPTAKDLADAHEDQVLAMWAGLGYYSRAHNLHRAMQKVVYELDGQFPKTAQALQTLPGIGACTAAAVAAFTSHEAKHPMIDGNVKRVLARIFAIEGAIGQKDFEKAIQSCAYAQLDSAAEDIARYTQGLMDLGATICKRQKPMCTQCPFEKHCQAYLKGRALEMPKPKKALIKKTVHVGLIFCVSRKQGVFLQKRLSSIWKGLWAPLLWSSSTPISLSTIEAQLQALSLQTQADVLVTDVVTHELTHQKLFLYPIFVQLKEQTEAVLPTLHRGQWFSDQACVPGTPTPIRHLLTQREEFIWPT